MRTCTGVARCWREGVRDPYRGEVPPIYSTRLERKKGHCRFHPVWGDDAWPQPRDTRSRGLVPWLICCPVRSLTAAESVQGERLN